MEHRWFLSEAAGRDVGTSVAAQDYIATVLPEVPTDLVMPAPPVPTSDVPAEAE
jgi:hypothetical protein